MRRSTAFVASIVHRNRTFSPLLLSCLFSTALLAWRMLYTEDIMFLFLAWNLFLAYLPYKLATMLVGKLKLRSAKCWLLLVAWLLLLPNSFYIITDLFHLGERPGIPLWYDLALLVSFAWNGLLLGVRSIQKLEDELVAAFSATRPMVFVYPLMLLNALGIYIGRYLRFNSWDVVSDPFRLAGEIGYLLLHPVRNRFDWSMILCYSVLLTLIYINIHRNRTEKKEVHDGAPL